MWSLQTQVGRLSLRHVWKNNLKFANVVKIVEIELRRQFLEHLEDSKNNLFQCIFSLDEGFIVKWTF